MENVTAFDASYESMNLPLPRLRFWRVVVLLLFAACFAAAQTSGAGWTSLGPEGGDVRSLAHDPHDPSRIFLGTSAGELYLSTDGGASWAHYGHFGNGNDYVLDHVVIDSADSKTVYVAAWSIENSGGDIFKSRDGGRSWKPLPAMHGKSVRSFAVFAGNSRIMVAGALDGVFRSNDGGDSWQQISPANHAEIKNIESIAIDPRNPDILYAGTWHLPWKTLNGGVSWQPMKQGIVDDSDVFSIIIDQQTPSTIYLSACSGIYKSDNSGELYHKIQGIPFSARRTRVLHQDPANPAVVYAGTTEGLWKTVDAGKTWRRTTAANLIINDVYVDPQRPAHVLLATDRSGVLASDDGGQTVRASNHGFSHRQVSAVLADGKDAGTLYAGVVNDKEFGGVFVTHDGGAHWSQMNAGLAGHDIFTLAQTADGNLLAGTHRGVYLYEQKAARWRPINSIVNEKIVTVPVRTPKMKNAKLSKAQPATRKEYVRSQLSARVARMVVAGDRWYAATADGVYASYDHGSTWHGGPVDSLRSFYSLDADGERVVAATPNALAISHHHANGWKSVMLPSYMSTVQSVALSPAAIWISSRAGVFYSKDDGATWEHVLAGNPPQNLMSVRYDASAQRLLGLTPGGEVYTSNDGQSWSRMATVGVPVRSVSVANGRLLGITPFRGIVAVSESQTAATASSGGGSR